ncbi:hypothetical protein V2J09_023404 [Rumex salicifolius]
MSDNYLKYRTTLTRKIYDNETVIQYYKKKTWIFVSQDFGLVRILDEMLQSLTGDKQNLSNIEAMEKKLQDCLDAERDLLVLDDVFNTDQQIWDSIRASLLRVTKGCTGSTVVVTSQSKEVALVMGASLTHQLKVLPNADAWALFETKALANRMQATDLREIGKMIVSKCGGLPLAVSTLGSLLGSMQQRSQWEEVEKSEVWDMPQLQNRIMLWLLLASIICPFLLQNSWVAQGFIQPSKTGDNGIRALGLDYINSLLAIGLLQHSKDISWPLCMHDLIHDLALYISKDACLIIRDNNNNDRIPGSIGRVKHLRILILDNNPFEYLPESIGKLYSLQKLSLQHCDRLVELPQTITNLLNLRIMLTTEAVHIPKGMGQMKCLENLPIVKLEGSEIKELESLLRLKESLTLEQLENIWCKEDAMKASLNTKTGITRLVLKWTSSEEDEIENDASCDYDEEVMEGLQPHSNLETLWVVNFHGKRFPPWLSNGLYYNALRILALEDCKRCEQLPTLGVFPCLKDLHIQGMKSVEEVHIVGYAQVERLVGSLLYGCCFIFSNNIPLPGGINCPSLVSIHSSWFHSLKKLAIKEMNSHQITSLLVENVHQLTHLSEPLMK